MITEAEKILKFWFGTLEDKNFFPQDKASMWFGCGADYDDHIRTEFLHIHQQACNDQLDAWSNHSRSLLALIILLDQFSRHIHRNTVQAFENDAKAIALVRQGINAALDKDLYYVERKFFYMPLMHAEDVATQDLSVKVFAELRDEVPDELKATYTKTLSFAESHRYVIEKFGRFPELNQILKRKSREEEIAFLETGKYRFL